MERNTLVKEYLALEQGSEDTPSFLRRCVVPLLNQYYGINTFDQRMRVDIMSLKETVGFLSNESIDSVPCVFEL